MPLPLDMTDYRCISVDPPWRHGDQLPGRGRGGSKHYKTMTTVDIMLVEPYRTLVSRQKNAIMFLWRVASMQQDALDLARAWGYVVKSEIVWEKKTRTGKDHFGMGHYVRAAHETCLVCVRGSVKVKSRSVRSRFSAPVGRHSEKPDAFYELVERLIDGPRLELFARKPRDGWTTLGLELGTGGEVEL